MTVSVISIIHISKTSFVSFAHLDANLVNLALQEREGQPFTKVTWSYTGEVISILLISLNLNDVFV